MKKLTPRQQNVVDKMKEGWNLCRALGPNGWCYLMAPWSTVLPDVHMNTYLALLRRGVVKVVDPKAYPTLGHELSDDYA